MHHLTAAFFKAIRSLFVPGMLGVFFQSVLLTLAALAGFVLLSWGAASIAYSFYGPSSGPGDWGAAGVALIFTIIAWFLFPGIMPVFVNFFDTKIMRLIEREDYPSLPAPPEVPFWPEVWHDVRFSVMAISLNLMLLPLFFFVPLYIGLFYLLNGYLLGREFFNVAARRRIGINAATALRKKYSLLVTLAGMALVFLATLPFVNLLAPFWGIAVMTHLFHALSEKPAMEILPPR